MRVIAGVLLCNCCILLPHNKVSVSRAIHYFRFESAHCRTEPFTIQLYCHRYMGGAIKLLIIFLLAYNLNKLDKTNCNFPYDSCNWRIFNFLKVVMSSSVQITRPNGGCETITDENCRRCNWFIVHEKFTLIVGKRTKQTAIKCIIFSLSFQFPLRSSFFDFPFESSQLIAGFC